jgi:hypothetical protein
MATTNISASESLGGRGLIDELDGAVVSAPDKDQTVDFHLNLMSSSGPLPRDGHRARAGQLRLRNLELPRDVSPTQRERINRAGRPGRALADHPRQRDDHVEQRLTDGQPPLSRRRTGHLSAISGSPPATRACAARPTLHGRARVPWSRLPRSQQWLPAAARPQTRHE